MTRIILAYPGGEVELFAYKRAVPAQQITDKLATVASTVFNSWQWGDSDVPAIEQLEGNLILMAVQGPSAKECFL